MGAHVLIYKFLKNKVLGSTLSNVHRFNIITRPGNNPITDYSLPPYVNKKRCKITFHTTRISTRPGNTPITDYSLPPYVNKKRCKITFHTARISTRPGNTPITDYSLSSYDNNTRCKTTVHATHILTRPGNIIITLKSLPVKMQEHNSTIKFKVSQECRAMLRNFRKCFLWPTLFQIFNTSLFSIFKKC